MNYSKAVQVVQSRYQLPNEGAGGCFCETLLLEVAPDVRKKLPSLCYFRHQAVEIVCLHCLVKAYDIRVT